MRLHQVIAGAAFMAAIAVSGPAGAFETTTINGTNSDGSAKYQDPDDKSAQSQLGGLQMGVQGNGFSDNSNSDSGAPPWQLKPTPPSAGFYSPGFGAPSFARP